MSDSNPTVEERLARIEEVVFKDEQSIDDALAGLAMIGQAQAQVIGDFAHSLSEMLPELLDSIGRIHGAYAGDWDEDDDEDSEVSSQQHPSLSVIPGGNQGGTSTDEDD